MVSEEAPADASAPGIPAPPERILLAESMDLSRLMDLCAERLGLVIHYDAAELGSTGLTVRAPAGSGPLAGEELWTLANALLASRGFTTVRADGTGALWVVRIADASKIALPADAGDGAIILSRSHDQGGDAHAKQTLEPGFSCVVFRAKRLTAKALADALQPLIGRAPGSGGGSGNGGGGGGAAAAWGGGGAIPLGDSGLVLISELESRLPLLLEMAERLDAPRHGGDDLSPVRIEVVSTSAVAAAALLEQVLAKRELAGAGRLEGQVVPLPSGLPGEAEALLLLSPREDEATWRGLISELDRPPPEGLTRTYAPRSFGLKDVSALVTRTIGAETSGAAGNGGLRIVEDDLTGSLIITASPAAHRRIEELIARLDSAPDTERRPVRSIAVRNRNVDDLLGLLDRLIRAGALEGEIQDSAASPGGNAPDPLHSDDRSGSNRTDSPKPGDPGRIVRSVDAGRAGSRDVQSGGAGRGGDWERGGSVGNGVGSGGVGGEGGGGGWLLTSDPTTNSLIAIGEPRELDRLEQLVRSLDVLQPQVMVEVVLVSLSDSNTLDLGVELERLELTGGTAIKLASLFGLSTAAPAGGGPLGGIGRNAAGSGFTGLVLDPGEFSVVVRALETVNKGRSVSRPRLLVNNNQNAIFDSVLQQPYVSTNASDTVATTSFGGFESAGTQITVTPQIANGDHLVLDYSLAQSAFVGAPSSAGIPPPRQQTNVESSATIPDGYTIVIGGLEQKQSSKSEDRIPLIGSIPILGELFKSRTRSGSTSKFYIFITANVMRDGQFESLKHLSDASLQDAALGDDGWPTVEPRVIP